MPANTSAPPGRAGHGRQDVRLRCKAYGGPPECVRLSGDLRDEWVRKVS